MSESTRDTLPISFSILRLSKPELVSDVPVKLSLKQDIRDGEQCLLGEEEHARLVGDEAFSRRIDVQNASDLCGLEGYLHLPPSFGQLHLGEVRHCGPSSL